MAQSMKARFLGHVHKTDTCWLWTGAKSSHSRHGQISLPVRVWDENGKGLTVYRMKGAHVVAYELFVGPVPEGVQVGRTCFNPLCVRPDHLLAGSRQILEDLKVSAERQARGEGHGMAVLTEKDVLEIRKSKSSQRALGREYGVSRTQIKRIRTRVCWKHI